VHFGAGACNVIILPADKAIQLQGVGFALKK